MSNLTPITESKIHINSPVVFVNSDVPYKYANGFSYSTRCGSGEDVSQFSFFGGISYGEENHKLVRGIYCPFLGVGGSLIDNNIYNIKIPNYSTAKMKDRVDFEAGQVEVHTKNYIIGQTKIDEKLYDEKYRVEWYFYPEEAKSVGVCDCIVGKDCTIDEII